LGSVVGGLSADAVPVPVSPALFALLARCLQANRDTGGLFDITVNSPDFRPGLINRVKLSTEDACSLHFTPLPEREEHGGGASIILDLSGILKGYALERLRALLPTFGIRDALINLGNSSILSLGKNPSDIPAGYCLTTSGNATADRRHIRNPLTGEFITRKHTVSVTTANAIDGEIQSTVSFIQSVLNTHN
jgi:thiamine biosynthesis lipoprotein